MWQTSLFLIACVRSISSLWTGAAVEGVIQHLWQVCSIDRREDERHARVRLCTCAYDREKKRLTASILTSSFQSWLKFPFMKPVVLLSRQLSQWAQTAKVTSPVPLKTLAGTFFPYLTWITKSRRPSWLNLHCAPTSPVRNHCLVQLREALLLAKLWVALLT